MPSPFPGMDPYLEDPGLWPDFHHRFISIASDLIAEQIRPKYFVRIEERVYVSDENDPGRSVIVPDVRIAARPGRWPAPWEMPAEEAGTGVARPIVVETMFAEDIREARLEIIDREGRLVVTVIELVSPTNKVAGSKGRKSFELKRSDVMNSPSHWVEIDLLRAGLSFDTRVQLPLGCDYLVHVSRADRRPDGEVWPIRVTERLPVLPIPLKAGDPDVPLDLQAVLTTAYDRAGYDLTVDYRREPQPVLPEWAGWLDQRLKAKGLRTG